MVQYTVIWYEGKEPPRWEEGGRERLGLGRVVYCYLVGGQRATNWGGEGNRSIVEVLMGASIQ